MADRNINTLYRLGVDIASELTQLDARPWSCTRSEHDNGVYVTSAKDTTRLYIHFDWQVDGRLRISPSNDDLREFAWYNDPKLGISVSQSRGGQAIAKDIDRRLLGEARELRLELLERKRKNDDHEGKVSRLARRMAAAAKQSAPSKDERTGSYGFSMRTTGWARQVYSTRANVKVSVNEYEGKEFERVSIELSELTPEQAERVLRLAAGFFE